MNIANIVSLSRIPALFAIVALMFCEWTGAAIFAFVLFVLGAITDVVDGYLARRFNIVSNFGVLVDAITDKIFVIGMFVALLGLGYVPSWGTFFVLLILSREFVVTGMRMVAASRGLVLAAENAGKLKTFCQIFCIGAFLHERMIQTDLLPYVGQWFIRFNNTVALVAFVLATILTVQSMIYYLTKYMHVFKD